MTIDDIKNGGKTIIKKLKTSNNYILSVKAACGDVGATIQLFTEIGKAALSLPDELFYSKLECFLNGVDFKDEERAKMRFWIASNGYEKDNGIRLISYINNAESMKKVEYFANATRCALNYGLNLELYFRICNAIDISLEEDLKFLAENIPKNYEKNFTQNYFTQKLYAAGLMDVVTYVRDNGKHHFNPLAKLIDVCSISFSNDTKYPNPKRTINEINAILISQSGGL